MGETLIIILLLLSAPGWACMFTYLEFHVSSSGGLCTSQRDLLAEVGSWNDLLSQRHSVVLQVHALEAVTNNGVIVDHAAHVVKELDDQLGYMITWSSLQAKEMYKYYAI